VNVLFLLLATIRPRMRCSLLAMRLAPPALLCAFLLCGGKAAATAVDPPSLRCASVVNIAGDVTLTWAVPPDPDNSFQSYIVYGSDAEAGPYAPLTTILVYGQPTWTHAGAGAGTGPRYYYLTTVFADPPGESLPSDTLGTIFLQVTQSTPLGSAVLNWTLLHQPPLATSATMQQVELEHPLGTWAQTGEVDALADDFQQVITICEDSLTYRIALPDQLGCVSYSNLDGGVFADVTAPAPPVMTAVSVDTATGETTIDWAPSPDPDTDGYLVIPWYNGVPDAFLAATLMGQNNTVYTWPGSAPGIQPEQYSVAAFDSCFTGDPPLPNTSASNQPHTTIHAATAYDRCAASCTVSWTPYIGWPVSHYEVYAGFNGGTPALIATVPSTTLSRQHDGLVPFATYRYVVKAVGDSAWMRSLSNQVAQVTDYPALPQGNYLRTVTVAGPDHITVIDSVDQGASVRRYRLERTNNGGPWEEIASQPGSLDPVIFFEDIDVETGLRSYGYRVIVEDSCGTETLTSNTGESILLVAEAGTDGVNRLRWNGYQQWAGAVGGFNLYRSIGDEPFALIAQPGPLEWEAEDNVQGFTASNGRFCYYVEAIETSNPSGINAMSTSNIGCAVQPEAVWIPNAFDAASSTPVNTVFKPVVAFVDVEGYEFIIFNRWGQRIWDTADVNEGWDGRVNGHYVPQGAYAYYVAVINGAGKTYEKRGTLTFLCCP